MKVVAASPARCFLFFFILVLASAAAFSGPLRVTHHHLACSSYLPSAPHPACPTRLHHVPGAWRKRGEGGT